LPKSSFCVQGSSYSGSNHIDMLFTSSDFQLGRTTGTNGSWVANSEILGQSFGKFTVYNLQTATVVYLHSNPSDDRIKTNEEIFSGETYINYVKQIVPKKYKKYGVILTQEEENILEAGGDPFADRRTGKPERDCFYNPKTEYGVIAQDIHNIPGLEDIVQVGDETNMWSVDYRSLDTITLGAVKGLIDKIETLEARIQALEGV